MYVTLALPVALGRDPEIETAPGTTHRSPTVHSAPCLPAPRPRPASGGSVDREPARRAQDRAGQVPGLVRGEVGDHVADAVGIGDAQRAALDDLLVLACVSPTASSRSNAAAQDGDSRTTVTHT